MPSISGVMRGPYRNASATPAITASATAIHGRRRVDDVAGGSGGTGGADREFTARKLSYDSELMLRGE